MHKNPSNDDPPEKRILHIILREEFDCSLQIPNAIGGKAFRDGPDFQYGCQLIDHSFCQFKFIAFGACKLLDFL
jgi:hypothetical protein